MFDGTQESFVQLKKILAENTSPVYVWAGAGLSIPAGFPSWIDLRNKLVDGGSKMLSLQDESNDKRHRLSLLQVARDSQNLWKSFDYITDAIGESEYERRIISIFQEAARCRVPENYMKIFSLNIKGVITTNIDKLATRAYYEWQYSKNDAINPIKEFTGRECGCYGYVLTSAEPFILNLHGHYENSRSLIMRNSDIESLSTDIGYKRFMENLFFGKVVVFVGVNPTDSSVVQHLDSTRSVGMHSTPMFWITDSKDAAGLEFSDKYGIQRIVYSSGSGHKELGEVLDLLVKNESRDDVIDAPAFSNIPRIEKSTRNLKAIDFSLLKSSEVRNLLNKKACEILANGDANGYARYQEFIKEYGREIHNSWYLAPGEELLGLTIKEEIDDGAFGRVFRAEDKRGEWVAVKLLKSDLLRKPECVQSFRRGVRAMEILSRSKIDGVVKYKFASEIPAFVAMEYIYGESLHTVIEQRRIVTWAEKMKILTETARIIKSAHALPERVLHRDIRPQNIMLRNYDYDTDDWSVCVLDFDLAFHKGANEVSMQIATGVNGFLAPEQTNPSGRFGSTRSSRVDSYGFAMLCYYVITGLSPRPEQCLQEGWHSRIFSDIGKYPCEEWVSLPYEIARIVSSCTNADQNSRMDLYKVYGYLSSLEAAIRNNNDVKIPDLIVDEVACLIRRYARVSDMVIVDRDGHRNVCSSSGQTFAVYLEDQQIHIDTSWHSSGRGDYSVEKKILGERVSVLLKRLSGANFIADYRFEGAGVIVGIIYDYRNSPHARHEKLAQVLGEYAIAPCSY